MATRKRIVIDRERCIGCGLCVNACPGGALAMVDGKAAVVREDFCDGLGACIGECPVDAIDFVESETPAATPATSAPPATSQAGGCPSMANRQFGPSAAAVVEDAGHAPHAPASSALQAWPIQLHLVRPEAPQFAGAHVLIAASCTAFALGSFHAELLAGRGLIIACPKLDRTEGYLEKLTALFASATPPASVTVARMEVPCCAGLIRMVEQARDDAGSELGVREVVVGIEGTIISNRTPSRV